MGMVYGGDPTYHATPGETVEQAAAGAIERRLPLLSCGGKGGFVFRVRVLPGDTAAALAERWNTEFAKAPEAPKS